MEIEMATKTAKKKPSKVAIKASRPSASAKLSASANTAKRESPAAKSGSVVPFNPLSSIPNFNTSTPSFGGTFDSMESVMSNYKDQYEKLTGGASASAKEVIEASVKSSQTFAKGAEKILKTLAELAQESSQRNAESMKALMASRTLNEFAEAQNKLAQQNFDEAMSTATKLSEMAIKLYTEAFEPINGQMTKAISGGLRQSGG